ncbi:hypothetical protein BKA63DRAFT_210295 [Paraphoma chrysanthemicola]|nr:hypothetical protein BKA63DRAFT_210295 [Paraphoma chrysanthemicola]
MRNLTSLALEFSDETIDLPTSIAGALFVWTQLRVLELEESDCHDTIIPFLYLHKTTLTEINFNGVRLTSGTWKEVFPVFTSMPKLEDLMVSSLVQQTSSQLCHCFDQYYDARSSKSWALFVEDQAEITEAAEAVSHSYRTLELRSDGSHTVDFRLANAVINGLVELGTFVCGWLAHD